MWLSSPTPQGRNRLGVEQVSWGRLSYMAGAEASKLDEGRVQEDAREGHSLLADEKALPPTSDQLGQKRARKMVLTSTFVS